MCIRDSNGSGAGGYPVMGPVSPITDDSTVAAGAVGGLPVTSNGVPVVAGGVGGIPVTTPNGQTVVTEDGDGDLNNLPVNVGGLGGVPVVGGGTGGVPLTVAGQPIVINGDGGDGLVAGGFPVTIGGSTPATGSGGVGGGTGAGAGDNNTRLVTAPLPIPIVPDDADTDVKTGSITSIGPFVATVPEKGKGPYCKDKIIPTIIANGQINGCL